MATLQSLGIGSGLDVASLVSQLVAAERAPKQQQITSQQSKVAVQISAMGTLKGALGSVQSAVDTLKTTSSFEVYKAKSSEEAVFTVSAGEGAALGTYDIDVIQLATAHQLSSNAFEDAQAAIGTGTLTVSVGDKSFDVDVEEGATLASIRDAINRAEGNSTVRATIVNGADGAHLVLTSLATGASNAISVSASGGDGGLEQLAYSADNASNYTEVRAAQDALIEIAGIAHSSASNTVKGAIDGVTVTLVKADPGNVKTLTVERNLDALVTRISAFVTQYNSMSSTLASLQSYDAASKKAGALLGDSLVRGIESGLRRELVQPVGARGGEYSTLSSLGITMTVDGKLELDQTKLREALQDDLGAVQRIFTGENGLAARIDKILSPHLSADGSIAQRNQSLDERSKRLEKDAEALDARMKVVQDRYLKQFIALDTLLAQSQSTATYLTQQLANLPKVGQDR
jgi:flagellar hook-associated protein 2